MRRGNNSITKEIQKCAHKQGIPHKADVTNIRDM